MPLVEIWTQAIAASAALLLIRRICLMRRLPLPPVRLPLLAVLVWAGMQSLPLPPLSSSYRLWYAISDDLLLACGAVRLLIWAVLELPGGLGWWSPPPKLLVQLLTLGSWSFTTVLVVRQSTRFDLVGLVTTSAVLTAVIGLAAQEPLKDLFSGLELQLDDDFVIGDWLEVPGGLRGIVTSITWRDTTLRTVDDYLLVVPNSKITAEIHTNRSRFGCSCDRFTIGLDYDYPPARALALLEQVVRQHPKVLTDPTPRVRIKAFDESAITYELQAWQREPGDRAMLDLRSDLLEQIWYALKREGQTIPYPVRELSRRQSAIPADLAQLPSSETCCQALASHGVFAELTPPQLRQLVAGSQLLRYGPGEAVVVEGSEGESLYHLLRGRVEVIKQIEDNRSISVRQLQPGDVFGEMTLFLDAPRSATVRTLEECLLLRVGRPVVRELLQESPALLECIATLVGIRQAELDNLSKQHREDQANVLIETMKNLFLAVRGG
jgi:small-conductance mechanosensitive channel/CRP-like cAMP-binding protein